MKVENTSPMSMCIDVKHGKTYFDAALMGTASDTLSAIVLLAALVFLPPIAEYAVAAVAKSVPRVRYSVFMARPKMTL